MEMQTLFGVCLVVVGLSFILYMTLRSRWIIQQISHKKDEKSTRVILRDLQNGR